MPAEVHTKRIYDPPSADDGQRILVDRIWPRGVSKQAAALTLWLKEVAPSTELRQWFGHDPARWQAFRQRYAAELDRNPDAVARLRELVKAGRVTLLYAAQDREHNQAVALAEHLRGASRTDRLPD